MSAEDNKGSGSGGASGGGGAGSGKPAGGPAGDGKPGGGGEGGGGKPGRKRPPRRRPRRRRKPGADGEGGPQGGAGGKDAGGKKPEGGKPGGGRSGRRRRKRRSGGGGQGGGEPGPGREGGGPEDKLGQREAPNKSRRRRRRSGKRPEGGGDQRGQPRQDRGGGRGNQDKDRSGGRPQRGKELPRENEVRSTAGGLRPPSPDKPVKRGRPLEEEMLWVEVKRDDPDDEESHLDWSEPEEEKERKVSLYNMVQVRFRDRAKVSTFDAGEHMVEAGDELVLETEQGLAVGVAVGRSLRALSRDSLPRLIRPLDQGGNRQQRRNRDREAEALEFCRERMEARRLKMKLIRVEYLHGGNKAIFYFTSDSRVDFRELVRDLAQRLHTRIVMRQVGVRDEARMVGGIGSCGCELCCSTWLPRFEPVSIRMAKDQGMVLNPQKVSGQCGRLKCCLGYELTQYLECRKGLPKMGKKVIAPKGNGRVVELDILRRLVRVLSPDGSSNTYEAEEVQPLHPPQQQPKDNDKDNNG